MEVPGTAAPVVDIKDATGMDATADGEPHRRRLTGGIRKFVDKLPVLGPGGANNISGHGDGQYIPVACSPRLSTVAAVSLPDYYEIALVEYTEKMHSDLPPTKLRGYVQLDTPVHWRQWRLKFRRWSA